MVSASGNLVIAYNGEIYNHSALRAVLQRAGVRFRGNSDTEVLLEAIESWGISGALDRVVGMFAFAVFDRQERRLTLCRDRFGEKPLYYGWQGKSFLFGSELKALRVHPAWVGNIDRSAVALLTTYNYIPSPLSVHAGINKLRPGTIHEVALRDGNWTESSRSYWSATETAIRSRTKPFVGSFDDAVEALDVLMSEVISNQMISEVPLGAFLSGGIDSSAVVATMQKVSRHPVRTFTIGFESRDYDESSDAALVAGHLGTEHTNCRLGASDVLDLIPLLPAIYDEPFADASQLPTALVARFARQHVTVALSGDGGDEIFGGYNRYVFGNRLARMLACGRPWLRKLGGRCLRQLSPSKWDRITDFLSPRVRPRQLGEKIHKLAALAAARDPRNAYRLMSTFWHEGTPVMRAGTDFLNHAFEPDAWHGDMSFAEQMMLADTMTYLPDDILVKVDRAAMSVGLETRVPYLDHRVYEFAWSLPLDFRIRDGIGKAVLRRMLDRYIPNALIDRPKSGFALPIGAYLRGPLRDWAETLLDKNRLDSEGYFDAKRVCHAWKLHLSGRFNMQYELWSVIMFQAWLDEATRRRN